MSKMRVLGVAAVATGLIFGATGIANAADTPAPVPATGSSAGSADLVSKNLGAILKSLSTGSATK